MTDSMENSPALKMYGKMLTFTRLKLQTADLKEIETYLASNLSNKSSQIPVIIESEIKQDLAALVELLWSWGLQPIGVVTGILDEAAKDMRLAIFPGDGKRIERIRPTKKASINIPEVAQPASSTTDATSGEDSSVAAYSNSSVDDEPEITSTDSFASLIYDQMLRSGQSINHVGGDLILTNSVNNGAEVITDNSLHIYGRAQGRLVAGATGDKEARIFCQRFNPSLVSVAGTYCLHDNIPEEVIDKPVQVRFIEGKGLVFEIMNDT